MESELARHLPRVASLCERHGVARLELFGSAATGEFDARTSDYDFLVELDEDAPGSKAMRWIDFAEELEHVLGRHVDLVSPRYIENPYFQRAVDGTRIVIYDVKSAQAPA